MSGECGDDTRAVVLFITISAQLCSALSSPLMAHRVEIRKLNTPRRAWDCSTEHGRHNEESLFHDLNLSVLTSNQIRHVSQDFLESRKNSIELSDIF